MTDCSSNESIAFAICQSLCCYATAAAVAVSATAAVSMCTCIALLVDPYLDVADAEVLSPSTVAG